MINSLEDAIKHCLEVAEEQDMKAGFETDNQRYSMSEMERERCIECAKEHRQLAEWLRELKELRENEKVKEVFKNCDTCAHKFTSPDSYPCNRCCHKYPNQYEHDKTSEVNADDTNRCEN